MAEETVDALVLLARFDEAGLERSQQAALSAVTRFSGTLQQLISAFPAFDIDADPMVRSVNEGRVALQRLVAEARDVSAAPFLPAGDAAQEVRELRDAFVGIEAVLRRSDPSGALRQMARATQGSVATMLAELERLEAQQKAAGRTVPAIDLNTDPLIRSVDEGRASLESLADIPPDIARAMQDLARTVQQNADVLAGMGDVADTEALTQVIERTEEAVTSLTAAFRRMLGAQAGSNIADLVDELEQARDVLGETTAEGLALEVVLRQLAVAQQEAVRQATQSIVPLTLSPPDFSEWIVAADQVRREFATVIDEGLLGQQAGAAASAMADQLQAGLLSRLADISAVTAQGLIDPLDAARQADAALEEFSREIQARGRDIPPLRIRGEVDWTVRVPGADEIDLTAFRQMEGAQQGAADAAREVGEASEAAGEAFAVQGRHAGTLRNALQSVALQATGTAGPIGRVASALLTFGAGSKLALIALTGIAAIAAAWRLVTDEAREAKEAQDAALEAFRSRAALSVTQPEAREAGEAERARLQALRESLTLRQREAQASFDVAQQAVLLVRLQMNLNELRRLDNQLQREALVTARENLAARSRTAQTETQDRLAIVRQGIEGEEVLVKAQLQRELISRDQFFARRLALAQQAARAEIQAFQEDRARALVAPAQGESASQREERLAQVGHLDRMIALRRTVLAQQQEELRNEERIGRQAAALEPIQRALADLARERADAERGGTASVDFDTSQALTKLDALEVELERLLTRAETVGERQIVLDLVAQVRNDRVQAAQDDFQRLLGTLELTVDLTTNLDPVVREVRERLGIPIPIGLDARVAIQQAEALRDEIGRRIAAAGGEARAAPIDVTAFRELTASIERAIDAPFQALLQGAEQARAALDASQAVIAAQQALQAGSFDAGAGVADAADAVARLAPLVREVEERYRAVTAEVNAGTASQQRQIELLREQAQLADQLRQAQDAKRAVLPADVIPSFAPLEEATRAFNEARSRLAAAQSVGASDAAKSAAADADDARKRMEAARKQILAILRETGIQGEAMGRVLEAMADAFANAETEAEAFARAVDEIAGGVTGVLDAARGIGLIGEQAAQSIGNVVALGQALASVAANASTGNILGAVASGINLIGGLFGSHESAAEQALRENTEAIRRNTIERTQGFEGIGGGVQVADIIAQVLATDRGRVAAATTQLPGDVGRAARQSLVDQLEGLGLSFEQLQRVADEFRIEILADGKLVGGALVDLETEIRAATIASLMLGTTFEAISRDNALRSRLLGEDQSAGTAFRDQIDAAMAVGATAITDAFGDFEFLDAEEIRARGLALLDAIDKGLIDPLTLGGLSRQEIEAIITGAADTADALDDLAGAVGRATLAQEQSLRALRARIFGEADDPADIFRRQIEGLAAVAGDFAQGFGDLDLGNEDAVRQALIAAFQNLAAGVIPEGLTADEFQQFLEQGATFLESFNDEVASATERLSDLNLPRGFRREALAFQFADRGPLPQPPPPPPSTVPDPTWRRIEDELVSLQVMPRLLSQMEQSAPADLLREVTRGSDSLSDLLDLIRATGNAGTDGAALPVVTATPVASDGGTTLVNLTVNVTVQGGQATAQLQTDITAAVRAALREIGLRQTGNTQQLGVR